MKNRKFKINPQFFLIMITCILAGPLFIYRGLVLKSNDPILMGGGMIVVALVLYMTQLVPIPPVSAEAEELIAKSFRPEYKKKVLTILTNGYNGIMADGIHTKMLTAANGDMKKLKRLARAVNGNNDYRDASPLLESAIRKLKDS